MRRSRRAEQRKRLRGWVADYLQGRGARQRRRSRARSSCGGSATPSTPTRSCDLTGVDLQPAREFPVDGAAGEGFTNTGNALVMSPALLSKYLDAGKKIAGHAVLLPDGFRFSPARPAATGPTRSLAQIRSFYGRFTDAGGGTQVNLQGIVFGTNDGGRLPLEKYLAATIARARRPGLGRARASPTSRASKA